jgi:hypothetical protein
VEALPGAALPSGANSIEGLQPPDIGCNPLNTDYAALTLRSLTKYRDKLVGERKAWENKNRTGRGSKSTNDRHIEELSTEIAQIEEVLS